MLHDYVFYKTDESFDYETGYGNVTQTEIAEHGFSIEIDSDNNINISSLSGYGYFEEMNNKCKTLQELKKYIQDNLNETQNKKPLENLITTININLAKA